MDILPKVDDSQKLLKSENIGNRSKFAAIKKTEGQMKKLSIALIASAALLTACGDRYSDPAPMPLDPISQQLVGKKLTSTGMVLQLQEFNKMAGRAGPNGDVLIDGAWEIRQGKFCRTITAPAQMIGTECQDISIDGDTATLVGRDGPTTFIIEDS